MAKQEQKDLARRDKEYQPLRKRQEARVRRLGLVVLICFLVAVSVATVISSGDRGAKPAVASAMK
jgi:hypothetical protein